MLTRTPAMPDVFLRDLPEVLTTATEGPGTWSPAVIIGHLIYAEKTDWMPRLRIILEQGTSRPFDRFDHEARFRQPDAKSLPALPDEFRDLRHDCVTRLRAMNLTSQQLETNGTVLPAAPPGADILNAASAAPGSPVPPAVPLLRSGSAS